MDFTQLLLWRFEFMENRIRQLERSQNNLMREGRVTKTHNDGTLEVDMQGLASDRLHQITRAGALTEWAPATEGERVLVLNPTGEPGRGLVLPGGYTDGHKQPHDKLGEWFKGAGGSFVKMTGDVIELNASKIRLVGEVEAEGKSLTHNGKNVGDDHDHTKVTPGPARTGPPS
ncbi:hypothetical protein ACQU0X_32760 [Pseudovibrio ascidiaceicola]|uniref:hypothetical protein n=1 Tax=Pseudovibrio ascidiaceicola TaxID=285279 RepID=UPI003D36FE19